MKEQLQWKISKKMNGVIRKKLMKAKRPSRSIKQQYKHATNLDKYKKESRKKEKRLKKKYYIVYISLSEIQ